jgi:putative ABC transport system ATP-binding protein
VNSARHSLAIEVKHLEFAWPGQAPLFTNLSFSISPGKSLFISGPSGCGKSTLLNLLAGVMPPKRGKIWIHGERLQDLSRAAIDRLRGEEMGFIFQQFNLINYLSVADNILLPTHLYPKRRQAAIAEFGSMELALGQLLERLGLSPTLLGQAAHQLSIGQQQRVAAARAFIGRPSIVIADEPTSALDWQNQRQLMDLFLSLSQEQRTALVMVSHDERLSEQFDERMTFAQKVTV